MCNCATRRTVTITQLALKEMHAEVLCLAADVMLADDDDGNNLKMQLEKC